MGTFIEILDTTAPGQAGVGEQVLLTARIKNLSDQALYAAVTGEIEGVSIPFSPLYASIGSGSTYSFNTSITMPSEKVRFKVTGWYWDGSKWILADQEYLDIKPKSIQAQGFEQFEISDYLKV